MQHIEDGMTRKKISKRQLRRIRQRNRNILSVSLLILLIVLLVLLLAKGRDDKNQGEDLSGITSNPQENPFGEDLEQDNSLTPTPTPTPTPEPVPQLQIDDLDSTSAVLIRREDHQVLFELDADRVLYPASMTKIMTALVAIENISDFSAKMKIRQATYDAVYVQGASLAGFPCGVDVPVIDVLYGIMLPSGAECCVAIGEYLYGSEEALVKMMNEKAKELGMNSTHFVTSTGLHDEQHYTTVRDLAKLVQYALENPTFKMIYCSKTYTTEPTQKYPQGLTFHNTMFAKMGNRKVVNGEILGGKTGYTSEAGHCLASYAMVDGKEYILVTAGATDTSKKGAILDAISVYNQISPQEYSPQE